jgi:hypothetical protein
LNKPNYDYGGFMPRGGENGLKMRLVGVPHQPGRPSRLLGCLGIAQADGVAELPGSLNEVPVTDTVVSACVIGARPHSSDTVKER